MDSDFVTSVLSFGIAAVVLRVVWGLAVWFSHPESTGGWVVRALLAWTLGKVVGLI